MNNSPLRYTLAVVVAGLVVSPTFARNVKVPEPIFDEAAAREFPPEIYERIRSKIVRQTTFVQLGSTGLVRWSTRTIKLVDFVKARSQTYPDTYLFAMRYVLSVIGDNDSLAIYGTSCQVVVVYKDKEYDEPTVVCEPVNLDQSAEPS